jgi:pimeloyl-ACP methyl ester carboxylesterase
MWTKHDLKGGVGLTVASAPFDPVRPSLLCVHGSGGSGVEFAEMFTHLAGRVNAAALDLPGHGATPGPSMNRVEDYAAWVAGFIAAGPVRPWLLGHSLGGAIALAVGLARPELLSGLVLWGTGARLRVLPAILEGLASAAEATLGATLGLVVDNAYSFDAHPSLKVLGRAHLAKVDPRVTLGDYSACDRFDVMARLGEISLPTLVVCGENDRLTPLKYSQYLASHIAGARLTVIPGAGHMLQEEQPVAAAQALLDCLTP